MANIILKDKEGDAKTYSNVNIFEVPSATDGETVQFVDANDGNVTAGEMLDGKIGYAGTTKVTGTIPTKTGDDITSVAGVVTIPSGYYAQEYTKQGDPTGDATMTSGDQMLSGVTAYSQGIKYTGTIPSKSASDLVAEDNVVTVPAGHYSENATKTIQVDTLTDTIINGQAYEEASGDYAWKSTVNIPKGFHNAQTIEKTFSEIFPAPGTPGSAADVKLGYQFYDKDGKLVTGTMANNGSWNYEFTTNSATQTIPAGYHDGTGKVTTNIPVYDGTVE